MDYYSFEAGSDVMKLSVIDGRWLLAEGDGTRRRFEIYVVGVGPLTGVDLTRPATIMWGDDYRPFLLVQDGVEIRVTTRL